MRFAQWVLNQIEEYGYRRSNAFNEDMFYVNHDRKFYDGSWENFAQPCTSKDDWNLIVSEFLIFSEVKLYRGTEYHKIDLTRQERKAFLEFDRNRKCAKKIAKDQAKKDAEQHRLKAQTWP